MELSRGTNPIINGFLPDEIPMDEVIEMIITFEQNGKIITQKKLSAGDITSEDQMFTVQLTQEETLSMNVFETGEIGIRVFTQENDWVTDDTEKFYVKDGGLTHGTIIQPELRS